MPPKEQVLWLKLYKFYELVTVEYGKSIHAVTGTLTFGRTQINIDLHFRVESLAEDTLLKLMKKTGNAQHNVLGLYGFIPASNEPSAGMHAYHSPEKPGERNQ